MRNLKKYDTIMLEVENFAKIVEYVDSIKDRNKSKTNFLDEGVFFVFSKTDTQYIDTYLYFKIKMNEIYVEVYVDSQVESLVNFTYSPDNNKLTVLQGSQYLDGNTFDEFVNNQLRHYVFFITMSTIYMTYVSDDDAIVEEVERVSVPSKNRHKSKNKGKKVTYITRKKYTIKPTSNNTQEKREVTRHTDSWNVKGHYRTYKSGKVGWVNGYKKGQGKVSPKTYKVTT